jgi:dTDP-glucose 4,6-dehydratase
MRVPSKDLDQIIGQARPYLLTLRRQSIFLTGGTGFIGSWLVDALLHANEALDLGLSLYLISREPQRFLEAMPHHRNAEAVHIVKADVRFLEHDGRRYDIVIHAATDASAQLNELDPLRMAETVVDGTRRALEFARRCGASKMLMMSSGGVYGKFMAGTTLVREDYEGGPDPLNPYYTYSESKRMAELLCALYAKQHGLTVPVARIFALLGPRLPLDIHFAAGNFIRDSLAGGPIKIAGDGTAVRSYLYPTDLITGLFAILVNGKSARAYNIGSDQAITILDLANAIARYYSPELTVEVAGRPDASNPVNYYVPDIGRARTELGIKITVPLQEAIARTIAWYQTESR